MDTPEELAANLAAIPDRKQCVREYGEHTCQFYGCPHDDPDHIHVCPYDDFDFTEGEFQKFRLGKITEVEFYTTGWERAHKRLGRTMDEMLTRWEYGIPVGSITPAEMGVWMQDVRKRLGLEEG